jgi:hypothetical protein
LISKSLKRKKNLQFENSMNDQWLHHLPLEHPNSNFTDRVMAELENERYSVSEEQSVITPVFYFKGELLHGLTAALSTYLFIQSGILGKIMTLDIKINQLVHFIERLTS